MIPRLNVAVNAACFLLLAWLYGGDLIDVARAHASEVSAMSALPSVPFAGLLLALAFAGGGLTAFGVMKKLDGSWRGYRLMPIIAVVGLFVDLFVLSANKSPFPSPARAAAVIDVFERRANELSTLSGVSVESGGLEKVLEELGEPPWLVKGEPIARWTLRIATDCVGPQVDPKGAGAGTILYCAAADRSQAWVTIVGLPREERFGAPQVVSAGGQPLVGVVQRRAPEAPPEPQEPAPEGEPPPMYFETDAGNVPPVP